MVAAWAASSMLTPGICARMGAEMEAAVTMATVPDPWMRRTRVATMKGIRMGEMGNWAICSASC